MTMEVETLEERIEKLVEEADEPARVGDVAVQKRGRGRPPKRVVPDGEAPAAGEVTLQAQGKPYERAEWEIDEEQLHAIDFSQRLLGPLRGVPEQVTINGILYDVTWRRYRRGDELDAANMQMLRDEKWFLFPAAYATEHVKAMRQHNNLLHREAIVSGDMVLMIRDHRVSVKEALAERARNDEFAALHDGRALADMPQDEALIPIGGRSAMARDLGASGDRVAVTDLERKMREATVKSNEWMRSGPPPPDFTR